MERAYVHRHVVGFEETNLVGNVYYVNHVRWQGRCREMFLSEHAPDVLDALSSSLALATVRVSCDYLSELHAFDEVEIRMQLGDAWQNRLLLRFEYWRTRPAGAELVARGEQEVACMRRVDGHLVPAPVPDSLRRALREYSNTPSLAAGTPG